MSDKPGRTIEDMVNEKYSDPKHREYVLACLKRENAKLEGAKKARAEMGDDTPPIRSNIDRILAGELKLPDPVDVRSNIKRERMKELMAQYEAE